MSKKNIQPLCYSAVDLATLLRCSVRQIWNWHSAGKIGPKPVSLGKRMTRWDAAEVRTWWDYCRAAGRMIGRNEWQQRSRDRD